MAPMNLLPPSALCNSRGEITQRSIDFYAERAKGGIGLILTSVFKVENTIEPLAQEEGMLWPVLTKENLSYWSE